MRHRKAIQGHGPSKVQGAAVKSGVSPVHQERLGVIDGLQRIPRSLD